MPLSSNLQSLQRAKRPQAHRLAQADQQSSIDVLSLSIVIIAHLAVITFFLVNFGPEPLITQDKTRVVQVSLQPAKLSQTTHAHTLENSSGDRKGNIPTNAPSNEIPHASPTTNIPSPPSPPSPLIELPQQEPPVIRNYETHYFTRAELSEKAQVIDDVANEIALDIATSEPQNLVLLLFINEEGGIDKVELQQANLPEEAAHIVQTNFMRLKFSPGKIDGVAVKSQLSIEVHLEGNALPPLKLGGAK